jgi:hypothetical protein
MAPGTDRESQLLMKPVSVLALAKGAERRKRTISVGSDGQERNETNIHDEKQP